MKLLKNTLLPLLFLLLGLSGNAQNLNINGSCIVNTGQVVQGGDPSNTTYNGYPVYYNAALDLNYQGGATTAVAYVYYALASEIATAENRWVIAYDGQPFYYFISDAAIPPYGEYEAGLQRIVAAFADAARRAHRLGLDAIELHGAHGYLLHQFLSPISNVRSDAYGGSLENRMRFPLRVFEAVRAAVPASMPVGMRISATDWIDGGWDIAQSRVFVDALRSRGLDFLHVSSGGVSPKQKIPIGPGYQVALAAQLKRETGVPTIAVGLITEPEQAEAVVAEGQVDLVALARAMLFDPRWPWHAAARLGAQVDAPPQYWRSQPRGMNGLFGDVHIGMR